MKASLKLTIYGILVSFLVSCSSTIYLRPIKDDRNTVKTAENSEMQQSIENDEFLLYAEAFKTEDEQAAVLLALENHKEDALLVSEEGIKIYGGNEYNGEWSYLGHWSKENYISMLNEKNSRPPAAGSLLLLSWVLDDSYYCYDSGYGISIVARTPSILEAAAALSILSASDRSRSEIEVLRDSLFSTMQIKPGERRGGIIFFPIKKYSYYRIDATAGDSTESLYFAKSK